MLLNFNLIVNKLIIFWFQTLVCGGYTFIDTTSDDSSMALGEYSNNCQKFLDRNTPW